MRVSLSVAAGVALAFLPLKAGAQATADSRITIVQEADAPATSSSYQERSVQRAPFVMGGAAIGGALTAWLLYHNLKDDSDCTLCHPVVLSPVVVAGALVGVLGGLVVHGWVAESQDGRYMIGVAVSQ